MLGLNIGAGGNLKPVDEGWINIDKIDLPGIEQVLDLEIRDLPYMSNTVDKINMQDFLEHLSELRQKSFLENVFSVMKPQGDVYIQIPHLAVIAARYLDIMKNPTKLQHPLTAEQFAKSIYANGDHRWGYDEDSLRTILEDIGFYIKRIGSDGGQNLLCLACKLPDSVFIPVGGGLGDVIQVYLSDPLAREAKKAFTDGRFVTGDTIGSLWFRRLPDLKSRYPNIEVVVIAQTHSSSVEDFFEFNPFVDEVIVEEWHKPDGIDRWAAIEYGMVGLDRSPLDWEQFKSSPPEIYLSNKEQLLIDSIMERGNYIVLNPFARGIRDQVGGLSLWINILNVLSADNTVVIIGDKDFPDSASDNVINLSGKISARVAVELCLRCDGFIGTHSSMILAAWYSEKRTACIVPPKHDGGQPWEEFFYSENPTTWGADKSFNKTVIVRDKKVNIQEIVDWVKID